MNQVLLMQECFRIAEGVFAFFSDVDFNTQFSEMEFDENDSARNHCRHGESPSPLTVDSSDSDVSNFKDHSAGNRVITHDFSLKFL